MVAASFALGFKRDEPSFYYFNSREEGTNFCWLLLLLWERNVHSNTMWAEMIDLGTLSCNSGLPHDFANTVTSSYCYGKLALLLRTHLATLNGRHLSSPEFLGSTSIIQLDRKMLTTTTLSELPAEMEKDIFRVPISLLSKWFIRHLSKAAKQASQKRSSPKPKKLFRYFFPPSMRRKQFRKTEFFFKYSMKMLCFTVHHLFQAFFLPCKCFPFWHSNLLTVISPPPPPWWDVRWKGESLMNSWPRNSFHGFTPPIAQSENLLARGFLNKRERGLFYIQGDPKGSQKSWKAWNQCRRNTLY